MVVVLTAKGRNKRGGQARPNLYKHQPQSSIADKRTSKLKSSEGTAEAIDDTVLVKLEQCIECSYK